MSIEKNSCWEGLNMDADNTILEIDTLGFFSYFQNFYDDNLKYVAKHKALFRRQRPEKEEFIRTCRYVLAARLRFIFKNHQKNSTTPSAEKERDFFDVILPLSLSVVINTIGVDKTREFCLKWAAV